MNKRISTLLIILFVFASTQRVVMQSEPNKVINFENTDEIFSNPERGFSSARSSELSLSFINNVKKLQVSVIQRIYTIPQFSNSLLTQDFLNIVESDLKTARDGGVKLVLRFSYTNNQNGADAPLDIILKQIEQLKPIFQKNYDVIAYIEAGFIGAWGEWYYSSNGLNNTDNRRSVLFALLNALPSERSVAIRTPDYKRRIFNYDLPLTIEEAFNETDRARTGAHNDCFLASITDFGTYVENDVEGDKNYLNLDNRFVPQGGETCNPSYYSGCDEALIDLERLHWSVLNRDYNKAVLDGWTNGGCMDEVKRRLGYRFRLIQAEIIDSIKPSCVFTLNFDLVNDGFASPYNKRNLEIILRNTNSGEKYKLLTNEDPRYWLSGDTNRIKITAGIPDNIPEGKYSVYLFLSDPEPSIHDRADYAIRLANKGVWEDSTGYNYLLHDVEINANASGEPYSGSLFFTQFGGGDTTSGSSSINIDGNFDDWNDVIKLNSQNDESVGDALNENADLKEMWISQDEKWIYISYSLAGTYSTDYFNHVFMDTDNHPSTGFHSADCYAGIDYMIENQNLWKYTGQNGEWGWSSEGEVDFKQGNVEKNRVELAVSKSALNFQSNNIIGLLFNVNEGDQNHDDDYSPDDYKIKSYQFNLGITGIKDEIIAGDKYKLKISAYPNPFNNEIIIQFDPVNHELTNAEIYDILGRRVKSFNSSQLISGKVFWDGKNNNGTTLGTGTYFFCIQSAGAVSTRKLMLLK